MKIQNPPKLLRPILAALMPLVAFIIQWTFWSFLQPFVWFLFYPAVFFSSWIGGLSGGLISTMISTALVIFFFIPPQFSFAIENPKNILSVIVFVVMGVLFGYTQERLKKANRDLTTDIAKRKQVEKEMVMLSRFPAENPSPVLRVSVDGRILYANEASAPLLKMWNCQINEFLPQDWRTRITETSASQRRVLVDVTCGDQVFSIMASPIPGVDYVNLYARDITEGKQAEEALRDSEIRYRRLFETAKDGILILDADTGMIVDVNPFLIAMLGYSHEVFLGKAIWELGFFKDIVANKANFLELQQNEYIRYEDLPLETATGQRISVEFVSNVYQVDRQKVIQCNIRNITERKQAEKAIKELNATLEQKVVERTAQLASTNKELESFAYSVSHDLRAPLRGIDGWSQALLEDYHDRLDEQGREYLDRVRSETQRMGQLIDDMLQLSRVTRDDMQTKLVDLSALTQVTAAKLQETQPQRPVELVIQSGLFAKGDPQLLEIMFSNLLSNAFKFSSKTSKARIEFGQTEWQGKQAFFVRDNGVGFDMAYAQKLFGAFQRMHKASEFPGTGIGLATVQRIIHRHGGQVWAESAVKQGATFYFTLEESL